MAVVSALFLASAQGEVRVALMGSGLSESGEAALGLVEAFLAGREDLELLDRRTIGKVLSEHNLVADRFANAEDAVQLGQLLAVDVFIHAEPISEQRALAVTAYETAHGLRLLDEVVGSGDASELAEALAEGVNHAVEKWKLPAGEAVAIALMSVRNVDLPKGRSAECESLGVLLERRLMGSPDIVVVERKRLDSLNRDREITMDRTEDRLLSAPVLLDLDIRQYGKEGGLQATAILSEPQGAELGSVHAEEETLLALAAKLSADILKLLKQRDALLPIDSALESARFFRMACFWKARGRYDLGLAAAEAAYALDPARATMQVLLANALFAMANATRDEDRSTSLAYAARGIALLRCESGASVISDPEQATQLRVLAADNDSFLRGYGGSISKQRIEKPFSREEAENYVEFCDHWLAQSPFSPEADIAPSGWNLMWFVDCYFEYFPDPASAWRVLAEQTKRWSREQKGKDPPRIPGLLLGRLIGRRDSGQHPSSADVYRIRSDLWAFFESHEDPLLRLYGRYGCIIDEARLGKAEEGGTDAASQRFLNDLYADLLAKPEDQGIFREQIYELAQFVVQRDDLHVGAGEAQRQEAMRKQIMGLIDLFRVMLKSGDVRRDVHSMIQLLLLNYCSLESRPSIDGYLDELEASMVEAENKPPADMASWEQEEIQTFREWIRERRTPQKRNLPPAAANLSLVPVEMRRLRGHVYGSETFVGDREGAYVLSANREPCRLFLQQCMPGTGEAISLGLVELNGTDCIESIKDGVADVCLSHRDVVIAVQDEGVFLFNRTSTSVEALHETTTLPVTHPLSVGILDQKLYVGTDDGYLASIDMDTHEGELLIAAVRKEKKSPFDDGPPVHISAIFPDAARGRIVFVASVMAAKGDLGNGVESDLCGIWEYHPDKAEFKQLIEWTHRSGHLKWGEMVQDNAFVLCDIWGLVLRFDMESNTLDVLSHGGNGPGIYAQQLSRRAGLYNLPPGVLPVLQRNAAISPPFMARGEWLWTAEPWGKLSMKTYQWEELPPIRMPDGEVKSLRPLAGMLPIDNHQALLAEWNQLWLLTTEDDP